MPSHARYNRLHRITDSCWSHHDRHSGTPPSSPETTALPLGTHLGQHQRGFVRLEGMDARRQIEPPVQRSSLLAHRLHAEDRQFVGDRTARPGVEDGSAALGELL